MQNSPKLVGYKPHPNNVRLVIGRDGWGVYLSPRATVLDVAIVQNGLGLEFQAKPGTLASGFFLRPRDPSAPAPSYTAFSEVLDRGFEAGDRVPAFCARRAGRAS